MLRKKIINESSNSLFLPNKKICFIFLLEIKIQWKNHTTRFIIPSPCEKLGKKVWPGRLILDLGPLQLENIFNC
jgi:hypothetical protein